MPFRNAQCGNAACVSVKLVEVTKLFESWLVVRISLECFKNSSGECLELKLKDWPETCAECLINGVVLLQCKQVRHVTARLQFDGHRPAAAVGADGQSDRRERVRAQQPGTRSVPGQPIADDAHHQRLHQRGAGHRRRPILRRHGAVALPPAHHQTESLAPLGRTVALRQRHGRPQFHRFGRKTFLEGLQPAATGSRHRRRRRLGYRQQQLDRSSGGRQSDGAVVGRSAGSASVTGRRLECSVRQFVGAVLRGSVSLVDVDVRADLQCRTPQQPADASHQFDALGQ